MNAECRASEAFVGDNRGGGGGGGDGVNLRGSPVHRPRELEKDRKTVLHSLNSSVQSLFLVHALATADFIFVSCYLHQPLFLFDIHNPPPLDMSVRGPGKVIFVGNIPYGMRIYSLCTRQQHH